MAVMRDREERAARPRDQSGKPMSGLRAFHEQAARRRGARH